MPHFICTTCGTQYPDSARPLADCVICAEERQYVGWEGQQWTTMEALRAGHQNQFLPEGGGLTGIGTSPTFAIGQRALHVRAASGGLLWDCVSLVDDASVRAIEKLGGVRAIAVSHPHYYSSVVEWSRALGGVPVFIHADDAPWVVRQDPAIVFWSGDTRVLADDLTLIRCGGHFAGSTVLHWTDGADGLGALLTGDTVMVGQDRRTVSFMYSFPNYIPLGPTAVRRIAAALGPFEYEEIYGGWFRQNIRVAAKQAFDYSVRRYLLAISDRPQS